MEHLLKDISNNINSIHEKLNKMDQDLKIFGQRLERLEKMDSIEHRVSVNQIDLTDIKEIVEKVANFQNEELKDLKRKIMDSSLHHEMNLINKRLDVQLNMIAKNEEAIQIVGKRE